MKSPLSILEKEPAHHMPELTIPDHQPHYEDAQAVAKAQEAIKAITPVTTPEHILAFRDQLAAVQQGIGTLYTVGRCCNPVHPDAQMRDERVAESIALRALVLEEAPDAVVSLRDGRGQSTKPRSEETEVVDGVIVNTYKGDTVNGLAVSDRTNQPERMVTTAEQANYIETKLTTQTGQHIPAAHEMLHLPYESCFVDKSEAGTFLLSGDLPWLGDRTRHPDGKHVALLARVENPVGIKISAAATAEDIQRLSEQLNPHHEAGKLIFMLRLGVDNLAKLPELLTTVKDHAPEALVVCDAVHGNTRKLADGSKTRLVGDIIDEITVTAITCKELGMRLHGVHLEAMNDKATECIDAPGNMPNRRSDVDPNLNMQQLRRVIRETRQFL